MTRGARRISIRARLALIYAVVLGVSLLLFGAGVHMVLRDQLERSFDAHLVANVEHAASAFAQDVDASGRLVPSERLLRQFASTGGHVLLLDAAGAVVADSAAGQPLPIGLETLDLDAGDHEVPVVRGYGGSGAGRFTLHQILDAEGVVVGHVVWADAIRQTEALLAAVTTAMLVGGIAVVVAAAVVGLALARRALSPIAEVTATARSIATSGDLGARVSESRARDEVAALEVAFNEMLEAIEQSHETLRRFLADVSHQLRTPLTTIRAGIELAQRADVPEPERREILRDAHEEAARMARLVRDLLSLARAESGATLVLGPVELDALLVDSVRLARQAARHVRMSVAAVEPAVVEGDPDRLRELFGIVLDNAARYTPDGGSIVASLRVVDDTAVVEVSDTGIGVPDEERGRVFERLQRGAEARRLRPSGTGLGLSIARWIVEAHRGTIELTAREGGGTVVVVKLPRV